MNKPAKVIGTETVEDELRYMDARTAGLAKLRAKFEPNQISKLPKPYKKDSAKGNCKECGGYHGLPALHLDYVGHAALTDRLLDVDPEWSWEPVAFTPEGLPALDRNGGLWIRLTVLGVTRYGYGDADGKQGGNAIKEVIGDALRNAAMRFGAALDLWHKGELHADEEETPKPVERQPKADAVAPKHDEPNPYISDAQRDQIVELANKAGVALGQVCGRYGIDNLTQLHADMFERCVNSLRKTAETRKAAPAGDILDDEVPY